MRTRNRGRLNRRSNSPVTANRSASIAYGSNGLPSLQAVRWFKVPLPLREETTFEGKITFKTSPTLLGGAGSLGMIMEGWEFRPAVSG